HQGGLLVTRWLLSILAGLVLGGVIHIVVILSLPTLTTTAAWDRIVALGDGSGPQVLPAISAGSDNPLGLDPELAYAVCRVDLRQGPASVSGTLPRDFWSVAVYGRTGTVLYST